MHLLIMKIFKIVSSCTSGDIIIYIMGLFLLGELAINTGRLEA